MIPYNTRKVTRDILERDEIRTLKISPRKPSKTQRGKRKAKKTLFDTLFPPRKHTLAEMIRHTLPRTYRGGGVALFKEFNREVHVLLGVRRFPPFAGKWSFPGGGAEKGETLGKAAFRELQEELGVKLYKKDSSVVGRYEIDTPLFKWRTVLVKTDAAILGFSKKKENLFRKYRNYSLGEFREVRWIPVSKLNEYGLHPCVMGAISKYN